MQPMPKGSLMARAKVAIEQQQPTTASSGKQQQAAACINLEQTAITSLCTYWLSSC